MALVLIVPTLMMITYIHQIILKFVYIHKLLQTILLYVHIIFLKNQNLEISWWGFHISTSNIYVSTSANRNIVLRSKPDSYMEETK